VTGLPSRVTTIATPGNGVPADAMVPEMVHGSSDDCADAIPPTSEPDIASRTLAIHLGDSNLTSRR